MILAAIYDNFMMQGIDFKLNKPYEKNSNRRPEENKTS